MSGLRSHFVLRTSRGVAQTATEQPQWQQLELKGQRRNFLKQIADLCFCLLFSDTLKFTLQLNDWLKLNDYILTLTESILIPLLWI